MSDLEQDGSGEGTDNKAREIGGQGVKEDNDLSSDFTDDFDQEAEPIDEQGIDDILKEIEVSKHNDEQHDSLEVIDDDTHPSSKNVNNHS